MLITLLDLEREPVNFDLALLRARSILERKPHNFLHSRSRVWPSF